VPSRHCPRVSTVLAALRWALRGALSGMADVGRAKAAKRPRLCSSSLATPPVDDTPLLDLGPLVTATVVARPSTVIKSPYVADVDVDGGTRALAHAPGLELGGHCVPGSTVLLSTAANPTNKTQYAIQLVRSDSGDLIGAHPSLGNSLVAAALQRGLLTPALGAYVSVKAEVKHGDSRVDFVLTHSDGSRTLVEVKNVVCSDFEEGAEVPGFNPAAKSGTKPTFSPVKGAAYRRSGIFPIGRKGQKLDDGTVVVSARAIKHVRELTAAVSSSPASDSSSADRIKAAIVFVVNRGDCEMLSLTRGSCPVFPNEMETAVRSGVALHAIRIKWNDGRAMWNGFVPCDVGNKTSGQIA